MTTPTPRPRPRRAWIVAAAIGAAVVTVGGAAALWTVAGTGSGQSDTLTSQNVVATAAAGTADLYPGFTAGDIHMTIANPNPYDVTLDSFAVTGTTSSDAVNCPTSNVSVDTSGPISVTVPAGATAEAATIADVVTLIAAAPDGCQGVTFTFDLTFTGDQV